MNKYGVADRFLAQFSDPDTEKITFSDVSEIYLSSPGWELEQPNTNLRSVYDSSVQI
jgi:hypothetical protein